MSCVRYFERATTSSERGRVGLQACAGRPRPAVRTGRAAARLIPPGGGIAGLEAYPTYYNVAVPLIAYFDAFSGISGDMLVGALADCGADPAAIIAAIDSLVSPVWVFWVLQVP